ncbi:MAG TPA: endonuclease/exonuclease/phosphatase family protein, partial [Bacteroidia bacterium]|nr:endonuclease/exonuclease/phosphatase family protein [Bacteroidia bacterium]
MRILKSILLVAFLVVSCSLNVQAQQYKAGVIAFYNLENLFDTINQPEVNDEEFTPTGTNLYTPQVYMDKLGKLSDVLSLIG